MLLRKKKSLSIILFGVALFLFTISLQKIQFSDENRSNIDSTGNEPNLDTTNASLVQKTSRFLQESKLIYDSQGVTDHERQESEYSIRIISLKPPAKSPLYRVKYHKEKTTVSRDFLSQKKIEAGAGEMRKRFPTAIILGVKKAGTRALLDILRMHPNVIGASNEVYFFNGFHRNGLEWYRQQMPLSTPEQMTIEKSPTYFTSVKNTQVVNRMFVFSRSMAARLKLIVVVRDPVKRCVSEYTDMVARSKKNEIPAVGEFEQLILHDNGTVNADSELVKTGLYDEHLKKWLENFLESEIHFVSGEELARNPLKEIKSVEKFLELKPFFTDKNFKYNKAKGFPCFLPDPEVNNVLYCLPSNKGRKHADVNQSTLELLRRFYHLHNEQFYKLVKRNFGWS